MIFSTFGLVEAGRAWLVPRHRGHEGDRRLNNVGVALVDAESGAAREGLVLGIQLHSDQLKAEQQSNRSCTG